MIVEALKFSVSICYTRSSQWKGVYCIRGRSIALVNTYKVSTAQNPYIRPYESWYLKTYKKIYNVWIKHLCSKGSCV